MSNEIFERLVSLTKGLKTAYTDEALHRGELAAYAAALGSVEKQLDELMKNAFFDTIGDYGLKMLCDLCRVRILPGETMQEKLAQISARLKDSPHLCSTEEFNSAIEKLDMIDVKFTGLRRLVVELLQYSAEAFEQAGYFKRSFGITTDIVIFKPIPGLDFNGLDEFSLRWYQIDSNAFSFDMWNTLFIENKIDGKIKIGGVIGELNKQD